MALTMNTYFFSLELKVSLHLFLTGVEIFQPVECFSNTGWKNLTSDVWEHYLCYHFIVVSRVLTRDTTWPCRFTQIKKVPRECLVFHC